MILSVMSGSLDQFAESLFESMPYELTGQVQVETIDNESSSVTRDQTTNSVEHLPFWTNFMKNPAFIETAQFF